MADKKEAKAGSSDLLNLSRNGYSNRGRASRNKASVVSIVWKVLVGLFALVLAACCIGAFAVINMCEDWLDDLPDYTNADAFNTIEPTLVYAADGETLLAEFTLENRTPLDSLEQISPYVTEGTVATEDERFYEHNGVDLLGIGRAVLNNLMGGTLEGASTITQQLVRNTILADEMTDISLKRKVREAYIAIEMEKIYSKEDILLMYLNTINYGAGSYGIEAAAERYYSKHAIDLTLEEASMLIGIPQSPSYNNPLYYPENADNRQWVVLNRMVNYGCISQEEADAANAAELALDPTEPSVDGFIKYPYFASYIRDSLINDYDLGTDTLFKGGLTVYTSLDVEAQKQAEAAARKVEKEISSDLSVALTAVDPDNGFIVAMVGGKDFYKNQWNLASQGARQAGSSFKTFTLIAALEQGISPYTEVDCGKWVEVYGTRISNIYGTHYGIRSIKSAFQVSSNTGFVRLCLAVTPEAVIETAHRMGIKGDLPNAVSVTLGTGDVTTLEMAGAYATIASGGIHYEPTGIVKVIDRDGNILLDNTEREGERVLSPEVAFAATDCLRAVVSGGTGGNARLNNGQPVGGKTGTSEGYNDSWFCGITPQLSCSVWIGDPHNVASVPRNVNAARVFGIFMNDYLEGRAIEQFPKADNPKYTRFFSNTDLDVPGLVGYKDPSEAPDLKGMTLEQAKAALEKEKYQFKVQEEFDPEVPAGTVIGQKPDGDFVVILISKGPDPEAPVEPEPGTPDPGAPDPGTPDPGAPDPGTPDPGAPDPGTPDPAPQPDPTPQPDPGAGGGGEAPVVE
ncbi:MAG: transglycosylase domain-containing protein [Eggerthellaceae bacterium]|nr:transglycosylase domain-containing protein [Eggerthellaceae bacterium]